jgi:hypothetical protein
VKGWCSPTGGERTVNPSVFNDSNPGGYVHLFPYLAHKVLCFNRQCKAHSETDVAKLISVKDYPLQTSVYVALSLCLLSQRHMYMCALFNEMVQYLMFYVFLYFTWVSFYNNALSVLVVR